MLKGEKDLGNFIIKVIQTGKPLIVKAESEEEAYELIKTRIVYNKLEFSVDRYDISVRNEKQHWFKSFLKRLFFLID